MKTTIAAIFIVTMMMSGCATIWEGMQAAGVGSGRSTGVSAVYLPGANGTVRAYSCYSVGNTVSCR